MNKVPSAVFALTCSHRLFSLLSFASFQGSILSGKKCALHILGKEAGNLERNERIHGMRV